VPKTPLISVLTPAFRCGKYLEQNLQSVQDQFYPSIEHIVVDGGSTDGTVEILKKYPSVKWVSEPDKGEADALNKAVAMSRGEYLMWLNADDYFWTEEAVEASMEAVGRFSGEKFPITHGNLVLIDDQDRPAGLRVANGPVHLPLLYRWFRHIHLNIVTMMFPRKLLEAIGPFRTDLSYSIDLDFWIRAAKAGATFHHLDRPITAVRITRSSGKLRTCSPRVICKLILPTGWRTPPAAASASSSLSPLAVNGMRTLLLTSPTTVTLLVAFCSTRTTTWG
jgi:glycosyltransferase involved in cell wall biosynthesis